MIWDLLVSGLLSLVTALTSLIPPISGLPSSDIPPEAVAFANLSSVLPVGPLVAGMTLILASMVGVGTFNLSVWIWHQFHGAD